MKSHYANGILCQTIPRLIPGAKFESKRGLLPYFLGIKESSLILVSGNQRVKRGWLIFSRQAHFIHVVWETGNCQPYPEWGHTLQLNKIILLGWGKRESSYWRDNDSKRKLIGCGQLPHKHTHTEINRREHILKKKQPSIIIIHVYAEAL